MRLPRSLPLPKPGGRSASCFVVSPFLLLSRLSLDQGSCKWHSDSRLPPSSPFRASFAFPLCPPLGFPRLLPCLSILGDIIVQLHVTAIVRSLRPTSTFSLPLYYQASFPLVSFLPSWPSLSISIMLFHGTGFGSCFLAVFTADVFGLCFSESRLWWMCASRKL